MATLNMSETLIQTQLTENEDGRHRRTDASRARIVAAMIDLVKAGNPSPRAEDVAEKAGVGLRTVFRLFQDMEGLYREMHFSIMAKVEPMLRERLPVGTLRETVRALCERRSRLFEEILHLRSAGELRRHRSGFLQKSHMEFMQLQRHMVCQILPKTILENSVAINSIEAAMSFDLWRHLRFNQGLSATAAESVVWNLVEPCL